MPTYAELDGTGAVVAVVTSSSPPVLPTPVIDITNTVPQPGVGWTTANDGQTWSAPAANSALGNEAALLAKAANALSNNITYIGITSPTTAQAVAQVAALTRQVDALIRLAADQLTDTLGT